MPKSRTLLCLLIALLTNVGALHSQNALIVSFSNMELIKDADPLQIKLEWALFEKDSTKKDLKKAQFKPYTPQENIDFILIVNGDTLKVPGYSFAYSNNVQIDSAYVCSIKFRSSEKFIDVTDQANTDNEQYNRAIFIVKEVEPPGWEFPLIDAIASYFRDFIKYGRVLGIAYILTGVFTVGCVVALFYFFRLFRKRTWPNYIRETVKSLDTFLLHPSRIEELENPIAELIRVVKAKLDQYEYPRIRKDIREKDSHKRYRIERSMKGAAAAEVDRLALRTKSKLFDYFLSIEHFWNFGVLAPLLGLLGTVVGISHAFGTVSILSGLGDEDVIAKLSIGINWALYTTIGGLVVGIVFMGLYYFFIWRLDKIHKSLDEACDIIVNRI